MGHITVPDELIAEAARHGLDVEQEVTRLLKRRMRSISHDAWLAENQAAIEAYNADVAENGLPLDAYRQF